MSLLESYLTTRQFPTVLWYNSHKRARLHKKDFYGTINSAIKRSTPLTYAHLEADRPRRTQASSRSCMALAFPGSAR